MQIFLSLGLDRFLAWSALILQKTLWDVAQRDADSQPLPDASAPPGRMGARRRVRRKKIGSFLFPRNRFRVERFIVHHQSPEPTSVQKWFFPRLLWC